ncbi:MAG: peptide deformylase [Firmicutes bacterium]|nr:peptide deformylase [Bacillota bacterium]
MALRHIVKEGDDILRKHCRPVDKVDDRIRMILDDMVETMRAEDGVGVAAPQIGMMRRMFVMEPEPDKVYKLVNPEIIETSGTQEFEEGCLSVPGLMGTVERPQTVKMKALDENGQPMIYTFTDFYAVVASHEYDHLEGILFTDKAKNIRTAEEIAAENAAAKEKEGQD